MKLSRCDQMLAELGHPVQRLDSTSVLRFRDGTPYRLEIPSCEGPQVMEAVLQEAEARAVPVHRVAQGSGVMMLTDDEIAAMVALGREHDVEVCLFLDPRGAWDIGGQAKVSAAVAAAARGGTGVSACLADAFRAVELGVRSLLVGDLGVLDLLGRLKQAGRLPRELVLTTSVLIPLTNAPTATLYERVGATSLNVSTELDVTTLAEIRQPVQVPLDMYVEVADDQGGSVRFYDVPEVVRVAAPVYLKLGLRNASNIYPSGQHLLPTAEVLGRECVRRVQLVLRLLAEQRADDVAVPA